MITRISIELDFWHAYWIGLTEVDLEMGWSRNQQMTRLIACGQRGYSENVFQKLGVRVKKKG